MKRETLVLCLATLALFMSALVIAGNINNSSAPAPTMYTLGDIYNLIHNVATSTEGNHSLSPASLPTATSSYSVSQIYADLANLIQRENIATGTTYLGVTGDYGNPDPAYATTTVLSSSLTPAGIAGTATGYSLEDVYQLITANATTTAGAHDSSPATIPDSSLHSLSEVYDALINLGLSKSADVKLGVNYLGTEGTYLPEFCGGDGSPGDPYQICYWTQLNNIRNHLASNYILMANLSSANLDYADYGAAWVPIGDCGGDYCGGGSHGLPDHPFAGNFNGNGYTISDLTINRPSTQYNGLFNNITGNITNLGMINVDITGSNNTGGLVGYSEGTITNSYSTGSVSGGSQTGGLIGSGISSGSILDSYSTVDIMTGGSNVGGLAGFYSGPISNSYSTGSVNGDSTVGGLVGYFGGAITDSYSTGNVAGNDRVGGLVGYQQGDGTITNSYSAGSVVSSGTVGGLLGSDAGTTSNSFWDIETSGQPTSAGGTGTTTVAMQTPSTFTDAGWLGTIWNFILGQYPTLI